MTVAAAAQVLDSNVRRGSPVFERGHFLVLAMAGSQRDRDVLWQLLTQVTSSCPSNAAALCGACLTTHIRFKHLNLGLPVCHLDPSRFGAHRRGERSASQMLST